jgi:hypothetical protein
VGEAVHIAGAEDEAAAELKRVLAQAVLAESGGVGEFARGLVVAAEDVQQIAGAESRGAIGFALRVHQQRKTDSRLFAENVCVVRVAQADGGEPRMFFFEGRFVFAQLRDVLAAEHSAVVPQKHQHCRSVRPQRTELNGTFVRVRQDDPRKLRAERWIHVRPILG